MCSLPTSPCCLSSLYSHAELIIAFLTTRYHFQNRVNDKSVRMLIQSGEDHSYTMLIMFLSNVLAPLALNSFLLMLALRFVTR